MRRFWLYLLAVLLIGGAAAAIFAAVKESRSHDDKSSAPSATAPAKNAAVKAACNLFSLADAKQLLGDTATGGPSPQVNSSADLKVTTCTYTQDQGATAPVSSRQSATLLMRAPLTAAGSRANQNEFGPYKPSAVTDVSGYGDNAYWDPDHGQLNILKNNIWYVLSYGPATPADRSLDQTKQMADLIISQL